MTVAVHRSGLSETMVQECVERRLVRDPLTDEDIVELRRIRRLYELGINLPGIEVIMHMRRRILALQGGQMPPDREDLWQRLLPWKPEE